MNTTVKINIWMHVGINYVYHARTHAHTQNHISIGRIIVTMTVTPKSLIGRRSGMNRQSLFSSTLKANDYQKLYWSAPRIQQAWPLSIPVEKTINNFQFALCGHHTIHIDAKIFSKVKLSEKNRRWSSGWVDSSILSQNPYYSFIALCQSLLKDLLDG